MPNFTSTPQYFELLNTLDWCVFFGVLIITIASVIYGQRSKKKNSHNNVIDHLVMGRQLTLPLFIATLVATWYGGIFGVTEIAFEQGIYNFVTQGFFWYLSYFIFALFLVKRIDQFKALTLPDLIHKMFGPKSAKLSAFFNLFNLLPISYVISLGLFIQAIFNIDFTTSCFIGIALTALYSLWGGLRAVVFSDLVQFFVMCLSVLIVLLFSYSTFGGISFLESKLPAHYWSLTGKNSISETLVWGLIALSTLVDPNFYQRCFAAISYKTAKKGILLSTLIWITFDLCTTFGAMYARAVIPSALPREAYLSYSIQLLPHGLRGFFISGLLATILSTLDSYLFLAGTTLSFDILPKRYQGRLNIQRFSILLVALISLYFAFSFNGDIKAVWKTLGSYSASCLLFPVLYGHLFPKKISDIQFVTMSLTSVVTVSVWGQIDKVGIWSQIHGIYIGVITTFLVLLSFFAAHTIKRNLRR